MRRPIPHHRPRVNLMDGPRRIEVEVVLGDEEPGARDELVEALLEVLDPRRHSGRR